MTYLDIFSPHILSNQAVFWDDIVFIRASTSIVRMHVIKFRCCNISDASGKANTFIYTVIVTSTLFFLFLVIYCFHLLVKILLLFKLFVAMDLNLPVATNRFCIILYLPRFWLRQFI